MSTEGYIVLFLIVTVICLCVIFMSTFCCGGAENKYTVKATVTVSAPLEWVWENYPAEFDLAKIFGVDSNGRSIRNGIFLQFPLNDFPKAGSQIHFKLNGGGETTEFVTIRDNYTKMFQTVSKGSCAQVMVSTMVFTELSPTKTHIEWTIS